MRDVRQVRVVVVASWLVLAIGSTDARGAVCGDVDGTGSVTVTDGVQVLRGAAALDGPCTLEPLLCDVDDDGSVSITDGVVVLRLAAGLPATAGCAGAEVEIAIDALTPLLTAVLPGFVAAEPATTQPCATSGSITAAISGAIVTTTFDACVEPTAGRDVQLDGNVVQGFDGATFGVTVRDASTNATADFSGTVTRIMGLPDGGRELDRGSLTMTIAAGAPTLTFDRLTIAGNGRLQSGSVVITDEDDKFGFASIDVTIASPTKANVHEVPDEANGADFALDLASGQLTRARH